jgi:hypothetical protein
MRWQSEEAGQYSPWPDEPRGRSPRSRTCVGPCSASVGTSWVTTKHGTRIGMLAFPAACSVVGPPAGDHRSGRVDGLPDDLGRGAPEVLKIASCSVSAEKENSRSGPGLSSGWAISVSRDMRMSRMTLLMITSSLITATPSRNGKDERADVTTDGQVSLSNGTLQRKRVDQWRTPA